MGEWISVEDKLPRLGQKVILFSNGVVQEETYTFDSGDECGDFWDRDDLDECPVLQESDCWMPLPEAPHG